MLMVCVTHVYCNVTRESDFNKNEITSHFSPHNFNSIVMDAVLHGLHSAAILCFL